MALPCIVWPLFRGGRVIVKCTRVINGRDTLPPQKVARGARSDRSPFQKARPAVAFEVLFWMLILFHEGYISKREEKVQEANRAGLLREAPRPWKMWHCE